MTEKLKKHINKKSLKKSVKNIFILFCILFLLSGCSLNESFKDPATNAGDTYDIENAENILEVVPEFSGKAYVILNDNKPNFTEEEKQNEEAFEHYSELDSLGRCGVCYANICKEIMPTEERGAIGQVKPTGWHLIKYNNIEGKYLYNRCHLIGYQLAGENANKKNLITGTRYMNVSGMLPFEDMVADYVKEMDNHVLYRVTPIYNSDDLVATGVQMEGYSVEDKGEGICFNILVYNSQPGIEIDYANGESRLEEATSSEMDHNSQNSRMSDSRRQEYVLNKNSKKFHKPTCDSVNDIKGQNKKSVGGSREDIIAAGYKPCKRCNP